MPTREMARRAGFQRPILHGMCVSGIATQALLGALADDDPSRLRVHRLALHRAVYPGETIRVEIWRDGSFVVRGRERDVVLGNGVVEVD